MNANAFAVSASGLAAHRLRMDVIAANLANAHSSATPEGGPYRRRDVVLRAEPSSDAFDEMLSDAASPGMAVRVDRVVSDSRPPRMTYDPGHPHANGDGYVAMPNVDVVTEMVDLMSATRAYEANVAAINATKRVLETALEIGQA
ncbi:MAG TPA: flagellar basal body rod protein FlgC [Candidatus Binatia bacterium]|nr:flagellar basal body rod protein FlgC [Candidatus Binatia bacterium]